MKREGSSITWMVSGTAPLAGRYISCSEGERLHKVSDTEPCKMHIFAYINSKASAS